MKSDITYEELLALDSASYVLVDIRDESAVSYGGIPGALTIPSEEMKDRVGELSRDKKIVLYCMKGIISVDAAQ